MKVENSPIDVTIGVCVKDSERSIKEAVNSILNQTFDKKLMEVIVIDDGCKDQTIPIITQLFSRTDLKLRIYSTNGGGLTMARQIVIDQSHADLVVFLDGDMIFSKDFIQTQVDMMKSNPSIGATQGRMKGKKSSNSLSELEDILFSSQFEMGIHRNLRRNPATLGTGGTIFRVSAVKAAGGFDRRIKGSAEDADITAKIKSVGYSLAFSEAEFEHEFKKTLNALWRQYTWYGFGMHYFYHKHGKATESMIIYFLPVTFIWNLARSIIVFKATRKKVAFFLPSYTSFRAAAWWLGFFKAHINGYGHEQSLYESKK